MSRLDEIAAGCAGASLGTLLLHLFDTMGFAGNAHDYYDPRNSYLNEVVTRRCGIPISLSVLTIAVGARIGVGLTGIGMPGHFLLRDQTDPDRFVDPFGGGVVLDPAGCARLFHSIHGPDARFDPSMLRATGTCSILARVLANLHAVFAATGDHESVVWVLGLRTLIPGVPAEERAELAGALAATGDFLAAAVELDSLAGLLGGALGEGYARDASCLRARLN